MATIKKVIAERAPNITQETFSSPREHTLNVLATARSVEKNSDFAVMLRILDEKCQKCTPPTPLECISSCKTWKLKNELRTLHKNIENPDFMKDLMNVLKNDTRLNILMTIAKGYYSVRKLQQELRKAGHPHSQDNILEEYLRPLIEVGLAVEAQDGYHTTTFGGRLTELIGGSTSIVNFLPVNSECYEETVLKALLSGPKTFEDIKGLVSQRAVSRLLKRLKTVGLVETPRERAYIFFFRSKRDPAMEKFSCAESKVYNDVPEEGISAQKLAEKTGFAMRTIYKRLRELKGKKLLFRRKMPKAYCLTAKGEKFASLLDVLYTLVEETLSSSEQVFRANENIAPQVSGLSGTRYSSVSSKLSLLAEERAETMRRPQLEMYVDILEVLVREGPLKLTRVMQNANVNCSMLRECLDFLTKQGLVEVKINRKEKKVYAITQLGVTALKQFRELKKVLPIVVETGAREI
ncbi:MAG: winged helix-turn-helix domain-containing protein [Candidatus Bathyarchaeia archaeon]